MLLEFTVGNYRSFLPKKTLSLQAQKLSEDVKDNVCSHLSYNILKSLAIYGANSSGKSNLIDALQTMRFNVLHSVKLNDGELLGHDPFLLAKRGHDPEPTVFEVVFLKSDFCYRYGFSYSISTIEEEWLFRKTTPRSKEHALFIRTANGIAMDEKHFPEGNMALSNDRNVNDNRLFLSLCAQLGGDVSKEVMSWFQKDLNVVSGLNNQTYHNFSKMLFHEKKAASHAALHFFKVLQLGFDDLLTREEDFSFPDDLPPELRDMMAKAMQGKKNIEIDSIHTVYDKKGTACGSVRFSFDDKESAGTKKLFDLSGPIFDTLERGAILVVDELDVKMHPLISQHIIRLFNNPATNPHNAQLVFTTHDTHLLSSKMLRRDQIWFTEKDAAEQTDLYCLTDIVLPDGTKPRNDANYERNYIAGRYGAIPYIINE